MKKIIFSTMIASVLAFVGCQNEELVNDNSTDNSGKKVVLTANIQGAADSRVDLTPETSNGKTTVKVEWSASGEKFKVYGTDEDGDYYGNPTWFTQIEGTKQFEGTLPASHNGTYLAVYGDEAESLNNPLQYFLDYQDGSLKAPVVEIEGTEIRFSYVLMLAEFSNTDPSLTFEHQTAILKPTFTVDDTDINNTITQIVMGNVNSPTTTNFGIKEITIAPIDNFLNEQANQTLGSDIYIHLPVCYVQVDNSEVGKYPAGHTFTFSVTAGDNEYTGSLTIPTDMSIEAGKFYTATIELTEAVNYVWTSGIEASATVAGEGKEASPYLIQSANDLQWMIEQVAQTSMEEFDSVDQLPYYKLTHDLEIDSEEGATWTPIGTKTNPFVGYFDGDGNTISGEMHTTTNVVGFFGYNAGTISNLKNTAEVKDCRTASPISNEYSAIGSIAGYSTGKIVKCENSGNVTAANITTTYTGGICGYQCGEEEAAAFITECKNSGAVAGVDGTDNATGGIVAISCCSSDESFPSVICASENTGSVTNGQYVGGICGYANKPSYLVACRNLGEVEHSDDAYGGGIVGYFSAEYGGMGISGCYTTIGGVSGYEEQKQNKASYTFDELVNWSDYYVDLNEPEWVDEIIGPWDNSNNHNADDEMNYEIVQYNGWLGYGAGIVCNWHWERGENNLPILVAGEPEGRIGG